MGKTIYIYFIILHLNGFKLFRAYTERIKTARITA